MANKDVFEKCKAAKLASKEMATLDSNRKNAALEQIAKMLQERQEAILEVNRKDLKNLSKKNHTKAFYDRLELTEKRINEMVEGLGIIAALPDPIGEIKSMWRRPNGLEIGKMCVPLGVIGIIYEARPNVTVDAAALTIKSGNSVVLRGSSEAIVTNRLLVSIIQEGLQKTNLPPNAVVLIEDTSRQAAQELMRMNGYLDVLIPRGGPSLIKTVLDNATVPVIETGSGNCHIYVDKSAELKMAANIIFNAKTQRPGVCNAVETLLVHKDIYSQLLPDVIKQLTEAGVEIYGCPRTMSLSQEVKPATEKDWQTEYLDLILAIKVVESFEDAVEHINKYGTGHSEAIITNDYFTGRQFLRKVDAAAVYINASTRFTDGFAMGLGAEMGISTQKIHTRGPMGLKALTSEKFIVYGEGQIRQ